MPDLDVILQVEDDQNDALITQTMLRKAGITHRIVHVNDGWEAINYLAGKGPFSDRSAFPIPKLILLDIKLPKYDGFDVLTWLQSKPALSKVPVVVLTGSTHLDDRKRATELGAIGFEIKAIDSIEFAAIVKNIRVHLPDPPIFPSR